MTDQTIFFGTLIVVSLYIIVTYIWRFWQYRRHVKNTDVVAFKRRRYRDAGE